MSFTNKPANQPAAEFVSAFNFFKEEHALALSVFEEEVFKHQQQLIVADEEGVVKLDYHQTCVLLKHLNLLLDGRALSWEDLEWVGHRLVKSKTRYVISLGVEGEEALFTQNIDEQEVFASWFFDSTRQEL